MADKELHEITITETYTYERTLTVMASNIEEARAKNDAGKYDWSFAKNYGDTDWIRTYYDDEVTHDYLLLEEDYTEHGNHMKDKQTAEAIHA